MSHTRLIRNRRGLSPPANLAGGGDRMIGNFTLEKGDKITLVITREEVNGRDLIQISLIKLPALNPNLLGTASPAEPAEAKLPIEEVKTAG